MKKQLLILLTFLVFATGFSQTFTDAFITYQVSSTTANTVRIIDYNTAGGTSIIIPDTVTHNSIVYDVTSINDSAFENKNLSNVTLPNTLITIGQSAFLINNLQTITIPDSVLTLNDGAFANNDLINVVIGSGLTIIGEFAFRFNNLQTVTIPDNVVTIEAFAFNSNSLTSIQLGNGVQTIGDGAFGFNGGLQSVTIPSNVTTIESNAFQNSFLTCITALGITPPSIITGANDSFFNRSNINLSIPSGTSSAYTAASWTGFNSVAEGLAGTFVVDNITYQINPTPNNEVTVTDYNTAGTTDVIIPATVVSACTTFTVTDIGGNAFQNNGLTSVVIPNSVVSIGNAAFLSNSINSLTIPNSVITIGNGAFAQNNNMANLVLGNSVTTIGDAAFRFTALTTITIPSSVSDIGVVAFGGLSVITDIYCEGLVPPTIGTGAGNLDTFDDFRGNIHLHIPANTMGAYVTDTGALWTGFNPVTEDVLSTPEFALAHNIKVITKTDGLEIISNNSVSLENYTIYSITGAKVKDGTESTIATTAFSSGIYILKLDFDKGTLVKKIAIN